MSLTKICLIDKIKKLFVANLKNIKFIHHYFLNLNIRLLLATLTLLRALAAPVIMGLSNSPVKRKRAPAATGIPMLLYRNAQKRICRRVFNVCLESRMAIGVFVNLMK